MQTLYADISADISSLTTLILDPFSVYSTLSVVTKAKSLSILHSCLSILARMCHYRPVEPAKRKTDQLIF